MAKAKMKRAHDDTTVPPLKGSVDDALRALLNTPPPPAGDKATRKKSGKSQRRKGR